MSDGFLGLACLEACRLNLLFAKPNGLKLEVLRAESSAAGKVLLLKNNDTPSQGVRVL